MLVMILFTAPNKNPVLSKHFLSAMIFESLLTTERATVLQESRGQKS